MKKRVDVHVLVSEKNRRWHEECCASLQNAPINVHAVPGIEGDIGGARAQGFARGWADFVSFVDDDDVVAPFIFEKVLRLFDTFPAAVGVYTDEILIDSSGQFLAPGASISPEACADWLPLLEHPQHAGKYMHHLVVLRRSVVEPYLGGLAEHHRIAEPYLIAKAATHGSILHLPNVGYFYRMHEANTFKTYAKEEVQQALGELYVLRQAVRCT